MNPSSLDWTALSTKHLECLDAMDSGFRVNKRKQFWKQSPIFELWGLSYLWTTMPHILGRRESRIFYHHMYFTLLFPKETDLNLWAAWAEILPHLAHGRLQWCPEDRSRCMPEAMRHTLSLCYPGVEGRVQGHRGKLSPCRRLLSIQWDSHSCGLRKKTAWFEHLTKKRANNWLWDCCTPHQGI